MAEVKFDRRVHSLCRVDADRLEHHPELVDAVRLWRRHNHPARLAIRGVVELDADVLGLGPALVNLDDLFSARASRHACIHACARATY